MLRSPALAGIATCAILFISQNTNIGCEAFSLQPLHARGIAFSGASTTPSLPLHMVASSEPTEETVELKQDKHGIYDLSGKEDHLALLNKFSDKIIILKFFAPWCRACKGLEPKFIQISKDKKYEKLPLVFAQLSIAHSKEYVKSLGVLALPSVHIYAGSEGLVENFPCGPSKVPVLKKKIAQVVNTKVDPKTYKLKEIVDSPNMDCEEESEACVEREISGTGEKTTLSVGDVVVSQESVEALKKIPFFTEFTEDEFKELMSKATYSTFEAGAVIMKQGMPGSTFYVIDTGSVEIMVKGAFEDPLTTPSEYLGTTVNVLEKNDYFGERSLITGQPRAASIRALEKTRCFTFNMEDIPSSSSLSGKRNPTEARVAQVNDKYAVDYYDISLISSQFEEASKANQVRGSANKPQIIKGVDTDDDDVDSLETAPAGIPRSSYNDETLSLLVRFKLLRQATKCFEYILQTNPKWGDKGETSRRSLLVSKLTPGQRSEFEEVFKMIDSNHDGSISVPEMKKVLDVTGAAKHSDDEILEMINKADPSIDGNSEISKTEFLGVMAEAEFYYLFKETFGTLDPENTGYVQAGKLDMILVGLRDLISDDRKSIIDVDDKDMLIDYETFSRMMIGTL